ncbi:HlyD family efflux transporter periplasmic adaptor subunit [Vibrio breoganii]|uniref:efflux RND transporter periplasmic adaptor subunit n=1 Tax=Vibrio breoganii TaxID=553239 RepID=UPI000C835DD4|nr:HlyD family efflux transporter periplasmic adaptor subunit [Vibrio breoganii]PMM82527.1 MFP transporter [Vibrio breoganii]
MARYSWVQRAIFLPPVLLGVVMLALAPTMKAEPPQSNTTTAKKSVRVLKVIPRNIQPSAVGYGLTESAQEWEAQSELDGAVVWVSERFETGEIINKGSEILHIDPSSYLLTVARLEAEIEVSKLTAKTILESLKIAEKDFQVQKSEYDRSVKLSKTGHISNAEKDKATRELLGSQQQLQTLKNSLAINRAQKKVLETELALAKRDLVNTVVKAPFDIRITDKQVGLAEYVNRGELMLKADGIEAVEVSAQFPLGKMRPLRRASNLDPLSHDVHKDLQATLELKAGDKVISWDGKVSRSGGQIDTQTQSQSIVVEVDAPYQQAVPGKKPPLIRNTFIKVTLKAPVMKNQIVLPVTAIHNDLVYIVKDGKLTRQSVDIDFVQGQVAVIKSGVAVDDLVVLSKLVPAVEGMALKPIPDANMEKWLEKEVGFKENKISKNEGKS